MRHWIIKFSRGESSVDDTPHEVLRAAATVNRLIHEEMAEQAQAISVDDPDRRHKVYSLKIEYLQAPRKDRDRAENYTEKEVNKRAKDRLRRAVNLVVEMGGLPARTVKGPAERDPTRDPAERRKKNRTKYRKNIGKRENKLKVLDRLCVWYSHFIHEWLGSMTQEKSDEMQRALDLKLTKEGQESEAFQIARRQLWRSMGEMPNSIVDRVKCKIPNCATIANKYRGVRRDSTTGN